MVYSHVCFLEMGEKSIQCVLCDSCIATLTPKSNFKQFITFKWRCSSQLARDQNRLCFSLISPNWSHWTYCNYCSLLPIAGAFEWFKRNTIYGVTSSKVVHGKNHLVGHFFPQTLQENYSKFYSLHTFRPVSITCTNLPQNVSVCSQLLKQKFFNMCLKLLEAFEVLKRPIF